MDNIAKKKKGIILTLSGGVCWGISGCFGQYLLQEKGATAEWLVSLRLLIASVLLLSLGYLHIGKKMNEIFHRKQDFKRLVIFSMFGMLFCQYAYFVAVGCSNAGTATVLQSLSPTMILIFTCLRQLRFPKGYELLSICLALGGIFLLSTHGDIHSMQLTHKTLFWGLLAAVGATFYNVLAAEIMQEYGVYVVVGFGMLFAGIALVLVTQSWKDSIPIDGITLVCLAGVIVIGTAVAFSLYLKGIGMLGAFMGSLLGATEPLTAIVVSAIFLNSAFHYMDIIGFIMILSTVFLLSISSLKEAKNEARKERKEEVEREKQSISSVK